MWEGQCPKKEGRKERIYSLREGLRKKFEIRERCKYAEATYTTVHILGIDLIKCNGKVLENLNTKKHSAR